MSAVFEQQNSQLSLVRKGDNRLPKYSGKILNYLPFPICWKKKNTFLSFLRH